MSINLEWYKVFRKVVQNESFSKAARQLFMTQPAVSQIISQLERELDTRLFNRTSKGVSLTDEGSLLFEYVNSALNLIDAGNEKLYELKNLSAGELKIGVGDTISVTIYCPTWKHSIPIIQVFVLKLLTERLWS